MDLQTVIVFCATDIYIINNPFCFNFSAGNKLHLYYYALNVYLMYLMYL